MSRDGETITLKLRVPPSSVVPAVLIVGCLMKISSALGSKLYVAGGVDDSIQEGGG